jgi:hypothetical protein
MVQDASVSGPAPDTPRAFAAPSAPKTPRIVVFAAAAVLALLSASAALLWSHYGTAVFFEMIRAGFAACF